MDFGFAWYFLSPRGRISRREFWLGQALLFVVVLLLEIKLTEYFLAMRRPASADELELTLAQPFYFLNAALFWPLTAVVVKRLHDLNLSGWWVAASLALSGLSAMINNCSLTFLFMSAVVLAGLPAGTAGQNRFGADPLAPARA